MASSPYAIRIATTTALSCVAAITIAVLARVVMLGYGREFVDGQIVLVLLMIVAVAAAPPLIINKAMISVASPWAGALINAIWAVTLIVSAWFLVDRGAVGRAIAYLVAYAIHVVMSALYAYTKVAWHGVLQ